MPPQDGGGGGVPYNGLYGEVLPKRGSFFRLKGWGFHELKYSKRQRQNYLEQTQ